MHDQQLIQHYFPELTYTQNEQFAQLKALYVEWNAKINVISRKDIDELYLRHVLHSLAIAKFISFKPGTKILDIGTGGGFPGIPLAIFFPECEFVLCDSIAKKISVVQHVAEALQLKNVKTHVGRVENITGSFDFIVSRAVAPLQELIGWTSRKLAKKAQHEIPNGWICLKGGDLIEEASITRRKFEIIPIQKWFEDPFFETKRIVYVR
jgi:16S rRNA (guanine527-N7)-methyltransferase